MDPQDPNLDKITVTLDRGEALDFHREQYRELRAEALKHVDETRSAEKYVLIALGAYYGFLFTNWDRVIPFGSTPWWLPVGLSVCGGVRSLALFMSIQNNADYLRRLEETFCGPWKNPKEAPVGWEQFRQRELPQGRKWMLNSALLFWPLLIAGTIWVGGLQARRVKAARSTKPASAAVSQAAYVQPGDPALPAQ